MRINWTWLLIGIALGVVVVPRVPVLNRIAI
jgi:hypothetical protein